MRCVSTDWHSPAVDDNGVVSTSPLDPLHAQHAIDNCSWIGGLSVASPAKHFELGHIVNLSRLQKQDDHQSIKATIYP